MKLEKELQSDSSEGIINDDTEGERSKPESKLLWILTIETTLLRSKQKTTVCPDHGDFGVKMPNTWKELDHKGHM